MLHKELNSFIDDSKKHLEELKAERKLNLLLSHIIEELEAILSKAPNTSNVIVQGRIKGSSSLHEKILRKRYFQRYSGDAKTFVEDLPDLIGLRIICLLNKDEEQIYKYLRSQFSTAFSDEFSIHKDKDTDAFPFFLFSNSPQPETQQNGNDIFRINMEYIEKDQPPIKIELQIKSLAHMFWGEMEHMLFYKNYTYHLNSSFYTKIMKSIDDVLKSVDSQLTTMHSQLSNENYLLRQTDEIKELIAKTLYDKVQPQVKSRIGVDIDLREVYNIIVQLLFVESKNVDEILVQSAGHFQKISALALKEEDFSYQVNELQWQCDDKLLPLVKKIDSLANSGDVFWNYLIAIYKKITTNTYQSTIQDIVMKLMRPLTVRYQESFEISTDLSILFNNGIIQGIIEAFSTYEKVDFFLENSHQKRILNIIEDTIVFHQFSCEDILAENLKEPEKLLFTNTISCLIKLQLHYYLNGKINDTYITELLTLIKEDTVWTPAINLEVLTNLAEKKTNIKTLQELSEILCFTNKSTEGKKEHEKTIS